MELTLTENEMWYVKAVIRRGIAQLEETIENCKRLADEARDPENACPEWAADSMDNQRAYTEQLLRETRQYLPDELLTDS